VQGEELRNLTEELKSQQQHIEREKAQLTAILASMLDALVVVDSHEKILLTNAAYQALLHPSQELVLLDEAGENPLATEATPLARAARGETFNLTFTFIDPAGNRHWFEAIGQPVRGLDLDDWRVVVMRDITERSMRHLQEEFLSLIGHELRTPITIIKGYSQTIERWLRKQQGDFEKPLHNLAQVISQAETLKRLIDDFVDVNRLQTGKFNINFEPVRLDVLFFQIVETSQMLTTKLLVEPGSEVGPIWVNGDSVRLQQVILNLINNAITHAPTSPKISLSLKRAVSSNQAEIRVQDYGAGIKTEHLAEVFNRFYQVMHGKPTYSSGLGLGLFICQQIVVAHKGIIRVESTEGEGATFIVQLPLIKPET
jgi:two-component system CheB/CheR fusion protein